jgi:hypothetical protein
MLRAYKVFLATAYPQRELVGTMKRLIACLALCASLSASAQDVYPYNPDIEPDGYIGINDLLALLPIFGQEFEVITVDSDTSSAIVLVDEKTKWMDCKRQCKALGRSWDIISVDASAVHYDTLSATVFSGVGYSYNSETLGSEWWTSQLTETSAIGVSGLGLFINDDGSTSLMSNNMGIFSISATSELSCWCEAKVRPEIEYQVIYPHIDDFQDEVNSLLEDGWLPMGGVSHRLESSKLVQGFWRYAE